MNKNNLNQYQDTKHLYFEPLAAGVYAAINCQEGYAIGNAGIVDLGTQTLVFDTTLTSDSAAELRHMAERLTGNPITYVVNSHHHNDHTWGNQVFSPKCMIITSNETRQIQASLGKAEISAAKHNTAPELARLTAQYDSFVDDPAQPTLEGWIKYHQAILKGLRGLKLVFAQLTFEDRLVLIGTDRRVELITYKNGHSLSDTILFLPEDKIVFTGDLLTVGFHPYLGDGDPFLFQSILDELLELGGEQYVPGHGFPGSGAVLKCLKEYIQTLIDLAANLIESGANNPSIESTPVPAEYANWDYRQLFPQNLSAVMSRLTKDLSG